MRAIVPGSSIMTNEKSASLHAESVSLLDASNDWRMLALKIATMSLAAAFSFYCFQDQYRALFHPCECTDAYGYTKIAEIFSQEGLVDHRWGKLRLYAYPLFVAIVLRLSALIGAHPGYSLAFVQVTLYFVTVSLLARALSRYTSNRVANLTFFSLIANVFIYPYLVISLSDGISVCLLLLTGTLLIHIAGSGVRPKLLFALGVAIGIAIMLRPANIYWLSIPLITLAVSFGQDRSLEWRALARMAALCGGLLLAFAPQLYFNYTHYDSVTFMPVYDLGGLQIRTGISTIRYVTNLSDGGPHLFYRNIWAPEEIASLSWYFLNPLDGLRTMSLHVFAALDFDYLFCYVYDLSPPYRPALFLFAHFVVFWGVAGLFHAARSSSPAVLERKRETLAVYVLTVIPVFVLGWLAIVSISAVESRFGLPIISLFLPFAAWAVSAPPTRSRWILLAAFCIYLVPAWQLSSFIDSLK